MRTVILIFRIIADVKVELSIADFGEELTASFSEYYPTRLGRFGLVDRLVDRKQRKNVSL